MTTDVNSTRDDAVIGRAFRRSAVVLVLLGGAVALGVWLSRDTDEPAVVDERALVKAAHQARPAEPPTVTFTDISAAAGVEFVHENGADGDKLLPETMGPGCAFFDYDSDGDPDILIVNGACWPKSTRQPDPPPTLALLRNAGGRFEDVTAEAGLDVSLQGMGVAIGDYDGDGDPDAFVTAVGSNRLFENRDGRFHDVTGEAGVGGAADAWSTSATFFDADNDSDLDLFVCNYVRWSRSLDFEVDFKLDGIGRAYGPPDKFEGTQSFLYRNDGSGTFAEVGGAAGVHVVDSRTGVAVGKALAVAPCDVDRDGWVDLLVANDTVRNFLFRNRGDGSFEEVGIVSGVAYDFNGVATGAMGIDTAEYRNDGILGIAVGNFANETSSLYVGDHDRLLFSEQSLIEGVGPASRLMLTFGLFFFDYDLDGRTDLFQTNGHIEVDINRVQRSQNYRQPSQLFWNCGTAGDTSFVPIAPADSGDLGQPVVGRGAAYADIDADGDLDILLTQAGDRAILFRNELASSHHWIRIRLVGTRCNREALGARVELDAGGVTQRREVTRTRSYLSQAEAIVTFGLGSRERIDEVRVRWPGDGEVQSFGALAVNRLHELQQR